MQQKAKIMKKKNQIQNRKEIKEEAMEGKKQPSEAYGACD